MLVPMQCLLINYDGGIHTLLSQYIRRAICFELTPATGATDVLAEPIIADADLVFLHLTSPEETVRPNLALSLKHHRGVVITSPLPKQQFPNLFTEPFAFLTEPFSYTQFTKCLDAYRRRSQ